MSDDGWAPDNPMEHYVQVYFDIQNMMDTNPREMIVKENDAPEPVHHQGEVCYIPLPESTDDEDVEHRRKFFTPSLQMQRNQFVKDMLHEFKVELGPLRTMAVMGCGELSLEKYLAPFFADIGTRRVLSIDFCKNSLAQGKQRLKSYLNHIGEGFKGCLQEPTLLEQYYGNILDYDDRLKIVDCVCSTEVIEHMLLTDATRFMRNVLGNVQPNLFIASTPNHEYNVAFGDKGDTFRHDDHKFEFSRKEFSDWLAEILSNYPEYTYKIEYVGNIRGFEHLSGATQFAVIWKKTLTPKRAIENEPRMYYKIGERIVYGGVYLVNRHLITQAFIKYLNTHELKKEDLITTSYAAFWKINGNDIISLIDCPHILHDIQPNHRLLEYLRTKCRNLIYIEDNRDGTYLIIPNDMTVTSLLKLMTDL